MRKTLLSALLAIASAAAHAAPADSPQAAQEVVQQYYADINRGDFPAAYAAWDEDGNASGKTLGGFGAGFADTARSNVVTRAPGTIDAGMMQQRITVPVDVYATLKNGVQQHFRGTYTLHLTDPGVGAPTADLSWHIESAALVEVAD